MSFRPVLCRSLFVVAVACLSMSRVSAEESKSVYQRAIASVVAIVPDLPGDDSRIGTGWILDEQRCLILTNDHVTTGSDSCEVFFPLIENGDIVSDMDRTLTPSRAYQGTVIDSSVERDLTLIQLESLPPTARVLKIARSNAKPGETIHSIAGSAEGNQGLWAYSTGHVRQRVEGDLANGGRTMVLESDMATNCGNSGGPVLNDRGEVVAVVEGHHMTARLVSIYVDRESVIEYLRESRRTVEPTDADDFEFTVHRHYRAGRFQTGVDLCTEWIETLPNADAYCNRAQGWLGLDEMDLSAADVNEALELDPNHAESHALSGLWHQVDGDYEAATDCLTEAIRCDPKEGRYRFVRAQCYYQQALFDRSLRDLKRAQKLSGDDPKRASLIGRERGKCQFHLGEYDSSSEDLVEAILADIADYETYLFLAKIKLGSKDLESAQTYLEAAITFDAMDADTRAFDHLINLCFASEQFEKAYEVADQVTDQYPEHAFGWFAYGLMVFDRDMEQGVKAIQHAIGLDPENARFRETLDSLLKSSEPNSSQASSDVSTQGNELVSTNNVRMEPMPTSLVGTWLGSVRQNRDQYQVTMVLDGSGTGSLRGTMVRANGEREDFFTKGSVFVRGNQLQFRDTDVEDIDVRYALRRHELLVYCEPLETWIACTRVAGQ